MRHVRCTGQPGLDFFKDPEFVDSKISRCRDEEAIATRSRFHQEASWNTNRGWEDSLWVKGLLGDHTSQTLLDTIIFYNGYYFALRSGREHRQLRHNPCQIMVLCASLQALHVLVPKQCTSWRLPPQTSNPSNCHLLVFKTATWRHQAVQNSCSSVFISWHSGTQDQSLFKSRNYQQAIPLHSGVDEQLVMEQTGHRSLEGVCSYKRMSDQQWKALFDILNCPKRPRTHSVESALQPPPPWSLAQTYISSETQIHQLLCGLSRLSYLPLTVTLGANK